MSYQDNPRKVYGKVEIVYSDADISKDITTTESGNSQISHPNEVYLGYTYPTVRACTMDGHSTMDGTFQMIDDSVICGWWSGALSGADGTFTSPPYIELFFVQRPIISWKIKGDIKLGQYPVDFTVQYKHNGAIVRTDTVTANTSNEVELRPMIEDITSVRLTIQKWSTPNACAKIMQFFEMLYEMYEGDALQMFEVGEELGSADGNYNINSDTMSVSLHNTDRKFDRGYLRSLLILDRKIKPYLGIEKNGAIQYTALGTFYSNEWQVSQDTQWVKCSGVDKLLRLQSKTYVGYPLTANATLYDIAEDILRKGGFTNDEFSISTSLKDISVGMAFMPKTTIWDALQEIANAGPCRVYMDRDDRVIIKAEGESATYNDIEINPSNMFSFVSNITLTEFANSIKVEYYDVLLSDELVDTAEVSITLGAYESKNISLGYSSEVAYASAVSDNANIRISNFEGGVDACTFTLRNNSGTAQTATITISGNAIELTTHTIYVQDEASINTFGVVEYSHPASELVQNQSHAERIGRILTEKMKAGEGVITSTWRGNPDLKLGQTYDCEDRFGDTKRLICEYNKFTFDGSLKQETRGRKV